MNCQNHGERQIPLFNSMDYNKLVKISKKKTVTKGSQQACSTAENIHTILPYNQPSPSPLNMNGPSRINRHFGKINSTKED